MVYLKVNMFCGENLKSDLYKNGFSLECIDPLEKHFVIRSYEELGMPCMGEIFWETNDVVVCSNKKLVETITKYKRPSCAL